jgi:flagellar biosynthesis/type III secretory pathway protein FliH
VEGRKERKRKEGRRKGGKDGGEGGEREGGREEGRKEGREEGREEGRKTSAMVIQWKKDGLSTNSARITINPHISRTPTHAKFNSDGS